MCDYDTTKQYIKRLFTAHKVATLQLFHYSKALKVGYTLHCNFVKYSVKSPNIFDTYCTHDANQFFKYNNFSLVILQ